MTADTADLQKLRELAQAEADAAWERARLHSMLGCPSGAAARKRHIERLRELCYGIGVDLT